MGCCDSMPDEAASGCSCSAGEYGPKVFVDC
jgi:hypothetical protein